MSPDQCFLSYQSLISNQSRIENALPGRESFDVEIYGMVGIPEADLAEWRARRGNRQGNGQGASKRPKIEKVALTSEQLKAQLEAHKALMSGKAPPPSAAPSLNPAFLPPPPPANMMGYPTGPPPGFGAPPLPIYNRPPPGFGPPPAAMSPPLPMSAAGLYAGPPPGFDPTLPPPTTSLAPAAPRPYAPIAATPLPAVSPIADPVVPLPSVNPHQEAVKTGAKSRLVYADVTMSPEEKLASTSKYLYVDPDDAQQQTSPTMQYNGQAPQQGGDYGSQPLGPPASLNHSFSGALHAQSYPAISEGGKGGIEPASHNPEANTAEALARANEGVGSGLQREIDMGQMEAQAKVSREEGTGLSPEPVGVTELASSQSSTNLNGPRTGRARAADLF